MAVAVIGVLLVVIMVKVKGKAVPLHAMEALGGRGGPPTPIVQEAGWAPEPVWTQRLEEKSFASAGDRTLIARSSSP
jgi:hypothetical protein